MIHYFKAGETFRNLPGNEKIKWPITKLFGSGWLRQNVQIQLMPRNPR